MPPAGKRTGNQEVDSKRSRTGARHSTHEDPEDRQLLKPVADWLKELRDPEQLIRALDNQVKSSSDRFDTLINKARPELARCETSVQNRIQDSDFKGKIETKFKSIENAFLAGVEEVEQDFALSVDDMESKIEKSNTTIWSRVSLLTEQMTKMKYTAIVIFDGYRDLAYSRCLLTKIVSNKPVCTTGEIESVKSMPTATLVKIQEKEMKDMVSIAFA